MDEAAGDTANTMRANRERVSRGFFGVGVYPGEQVADDAICAWREFFVLIFCFYEGVILLSNIWI